jgi:hypothetical protein|tara:strand:+ start:290 stop:559 length:270 start_codon:yes stop_codon:yes gene_type:complete
MKLTKSQLKEMIKEELLNEIPDFSKPSVNDYVRDGGMFGKVVHVDKVLGKNRVFVELQKPKSRGWMMYLTNNLKDTKKRNVGKVIWGVR